MKRENATSAPNTHAETRLPASTNGGNAARKFAKSRENASSTRKPSAPVRNDGQRRLLALGLTVREVAASVGASVSTVHAWLSGASTPGNAAAVKLEQALGIPRRSWELRPDYVGAMRAAVMALDAALAHAEERLEDVYAALRGLL